jgi:hypothetical protein
VSGNGRRRNDELEIHHIDHPLADVWIGRVADTDFDYTYGGTRMVAPDTEDQIVVSTLHELATSESLLKNLLINNAIQDGAVDAFGDRLPEGFSRSRVGGARCIIRPRTEDTHLLWNDPGDPRFAASIGSVFAVIGDFLTSQDGYIKLTPDFGRYATLSDLLRQFTPHVLGISCEVGGCGGKTSYTTTGVVAAFEYFQFPPDTPITVIGSDGAMGSEFIDYIRGSNYADLAVSDIAYQRESAPARQPAGLRQIAAKRGTFTTDCLARGGAIIAMTWGRELQNSDLSALVPDAHFLLAHNLSIPTGPMGVGLARQVTARNVTAVPGQLLTLGGALTSRLEWFWRRSRPDQPFDKPLAHDVVRAVVLHSVDAARRLARADEITPYEAMLRLAQFTGE